MPAKKHETNKIPGTDITTEQVTEVTQRKKRGFELQKDFGAEPGENARFIRFAMVSWNLPPIDISDPKQVENRIGEYFQHCAENDRRPQIVGMCNWLGINRDTLNSWVRGETRTATHTDIIKKAVSFLEEMWADAMLTNKLNPGSGCFIAKNWFNYSDTQQIVVTPNNPYQGASEEELKDKYLTDIPADEE
jgi:hypothetical protein